MATTKEIKEHLDIALKEVGEIKSNLGMIDLLKTGYSATLLILLSMRAIQKKKL
jgi:hypothetical protein